MATTPKRSHWMHNEMARSIRVVKRFDRPGTFILGIATTLEIIRPPGLAIMVL
ncbi:MAG TPA: hypothetical protein VKV40_15170 [Ktedonobacteraceae bacterium]|jgi:hypothetical protein|nr:hypothetical protein [Ktedonobacteraceae bacterium]